MKYISHSDKQTRKIAAGLAKKINSGIIALTGELGAGKTTFAAGFAKGLGVKDKIISPTFVLIRQHKIPNSKGVLYHVDLYRLEGSQMQKSLGLEDLWTSPVNIVLIEWAEKVKKLLPKNTIWISFKTLNKNRREIKLLSSYLNFNAA